MSQNSDLILLDPSLKQIELYGERCWLPHHGLHGTETLTILTLKGSWKKTYVKGNGGGGKWPED